MNLKRRFGLYGIGFALGIALVIFFLNGKNSGCDYFPNARILKILREKPLTFSDKALQSLKTLKIDTLEIHKILLNGEIDFSKSKTKQKPCRFYWINGMANSKAVVLYVENCNNKATIESIVLQK